MGHIQRYDRKIVVLYLWAFIAFEFPLSQILRERLACKNGCLPKGSHKKIKVIF